MHERAQPRGRAKGRATRAGRTAPDDGDIPHLRVLSQDCAVVEGKAGPEQKGPRGAAQTGRVSDARPVWPRDLRRQSARSAQARRLVFHAFEDGGGGFENARAARGGLGFRNAHGARAKPESLLLEGKLIKEYRPRYNISFRDDKRFLVVKVDPTEEWPRFRLARFKKDDGARYFGPYAHAGALRQTLNFMRKKFGVLTFGRGSPTQRELKSSTYQVPMRLERDQRRDLSRASRAGVGFSRRPLARDDERARGRNAESGGETRFRESGGAAQHARGFAADDEADAAFHPAQSAEHDRSGGGCAGARGCAATADAAAGDGVFRHLEHLHDARSRLDGFVPRRRAG